MNRQEQSVERLKSCIADLKRLASNKVKRGGVGTQNNMSEAYNSAGGVQQSAHDHSGHNSRVEHHH